MLVLTHVQDTTADLVIEELVRWGAAVARLDTGDFPQRWTVSGRIDSTGVWQGCLVGPDVRVDLERVRAVYYRRPSRYRMSAGLSAADRRFAEAEAHQGVGACCRACRVGGSRIRAESPTPRPSRGSYGWRRRAVCASPRR